MMHKAFLSYEDWLKENPEVALEETDCEECDGEGVVDCWHCGNETDCKECGGQGKVNTARKVYERQLLEDAKKFEKYAKTLQAVPE